MKKKDELDELRPEYDLTRLRGAVKGKYARRHAAGSNVVVLEADVAAAFPTEQSVNDALRLLLRIARTSVPSPR